MSLIALDRDGLAAITERLASGSAAVVPLPTPLPYVVVAHDPAAVKEAKGRPREQPVGVGLASLDPVAATLDLDAKTLALVRWLCFEDAVSVLVPVLPAVRGWLRPAIVDGLAFMAGAWLPQLSELLVDRTHLYMSSGNTTTGQPAITAQQADDAFGGRLAVLDGDALRDLRTPHGSTTMLRVLRGGELSVSRHGINDAGFGQDSARYLADVRRRYADAPC